MGICQQVTSLRKRISRIVEQDADNGRKQPISYSRGDNTMELIHDT